MNITLLKKELLNLAKSQNNLIFIIDRQHNKLKVITKFCELKDKTMFLNVLFITQKMLALEMSELFNFFNLKTLVFYNVQQTNIIVELIFICSLKKVSYIVFNDKL